MLAESLLQRGAQLATVIRNMPPQNLADPQLQRVRALAVSDLERVLTYDDPPAQATLMLAQMLALSGGDQPESLRLVERLIDGEKFAEEETDLQAEAHV